MVHQGRCVLAALMAVFLIAGGVKTAKAEDGQHLAGEALKGAFVGNTIEGAFPDGTYTVFFADPHEMKGRFAGKDGSVSSDSGIWEATEDGLFCRKWRNWAGGAKSCTKVLQKPDGLLTLIKHDGSTLIDDVKLIRGNVAGL